MTAYVTTGLWAVLSTGVILSLLGLAVRSILHARHERLCRSWGELTARNRDLCGHPGPVELDDYPGMPETKKDIQMFGQVWLWLMGVTGSAAFALAVAVVTA